MPRAAGMPHAFDPRSRSAVSSTGVIQRFACAALIVAIPLNSWAQTSSAQQNPPAAQAQPEEDSLPVSLDRIREGVARESRLELKGGSPHYYVEVLGRFPRFETFLEGFDLKNGPVPGAGMTHQEFLAMVTPKDLSSANVTPALDTLIVGLQTLAVKWFAAKVAKSISNARRERELQRIREEIRQALEEIEKQQRKR
jgi:hypothetical protein